MAGSCCRWFDFSSSNGDGWLKRPSPSGDLRAVDAILVRMGPAGNLRVAEFFFRVATNPLQAWNAINGIYCEAEAIDLVVHRQFHRSVDVAFLLVPTHVQALVVADVSQAVNQTGIAMEVENDRLVGGEQGIVVCVGQPVRVFLARLQLEQVDYIDETDFNVREFLAQ